MLGEPLSPACAVKKKKFSASKHRSPSRLVGSKKKEKQRKGSRKTNLKNKGLISTDRGTEATLMRTIPRSMLSRIQRICPSQYLELCFSTTRAGLLPPRGLYNVMILDPKA